MIKKEDLIIELLKGASFFNKKTETLLFYSKDTGQFKEENFNTGEVIVRNNLNDPFWINLNVSDYELTVNG